MTDIASLGVEVDTREASQGARDLDAFSAAGQRAQRQMDGLRNATDGSNRAQSEANSIARRAAAALGERTTSSESLLRAELALARALQARAQADLRILTTSQAVTEAELRAATAVATLARQRTESARIAVLEFTAMERAASAQESASAAAAELSSRYDLLSSKFTEGYREARQMDAALEDLAEAERLGIQITMGASAAIDQIILKYDARARAAAELTAELSRLRSAEAMEASAADGQTRFGPGAGSGKSAQESAALFGMMMDEELSATSSSAQSYYNRILGVQDEVQKSARESASVFELEAQKMEDLNRAAARLRSNIDPLGAAQDRYNREMREYNQLAAAGVISARELGQAHVLAASRLQNYQAVMNGGLESTQMGRQANLANVVAQFQDIGVTAQMGMNPLVIALQQGTQLTQAFVQMENPIKGIGAALLAMISPISILTIAMVALVAIGLQMVDWPTAASMALHVLADVMEATAPYAVALGAALAVIYSPAIITGIVQLTAWIARMGVVALTAGAQMAAAWIIANPVTAILAGIALIITGIVMFRDEVTQIVGRDIVQDIQDATNYIIGSFVGAFQGISDVWGTLPAVMGDATITAANVALKGVEWLINQSKKLLIDYYKGLSSLPIPGVSQIAGLAAGGLGMIPDVEMGTLDNPYAGAMGSAANTISQRMEEAQSHDYVGAAITGVQNAASGAADAVRGLADGLGKSSEESEKAAKAAAKAAKAYANIIRDGHEFITEQNLEAQALGMTAEAANALRYEQDMLNKAANDNLVLSPAQRSELSLLAKEMAAVEERTRSLTEWYNIGKSAFSSFMSDFRRDLMNGTSLWDSFANAASKALDSIADKALTMAANGIFDMIFGAVMGGIGGGFGGGLGGGLLGTSSITGSSGGFFPGFSSGGYTGDSPANRAAGIVHGKEFVMNAAATRSIGRPALDAMNSGAVPVGGDSNDNLTTVNIFNSSGASVKTKSVRDAQGKRELQVFVLETVADGRRRGANL